MSGFLASLVDNFQEQMERHRNRPFLRAVMAACAYVSLGDGVVTLVERMRMDRVLETLDSLQVFDPHEGVDLFNEFVDTLRDSPDEGERHILRAIDEEVALGQEKAALLIRVCLAVSERPEGIPAPEKARIEALCHHLGVDGDVCPPQVESA